ncbi:MAG: peptide chain release factor 1 [Spirochaetes bacterium]|nr:peptide chain release factor 1 [Spirochaetota bacterium]MBU1079118.1 peptide chain release factor 1 [Spirochaetota bacterium]
MIERLEIVAARLRQLEDLVSDPGLARDAKRYKETMRERSRLSEIMAAYADYERLEGEIAGAKAMVRDEPDPELKEMAREELRGLEESLSAAEKLVTELLVPRDPLDDKNTIMEIRAGTGGDEAALFVADLYRMYSRYADDKKWKIEVMSSSETGLGGFKEIILAVSGDQVFGKLRWESGVHRVQRVPATEGSGRIHTSAVTVAVLPEAEETEVDIRPEDLRVDVMRAGGPGGQCVNTTDSAVRLTHLPTGLVVHCQDEKSQIKNKAKALRILRSRIYELEEEKKNAERAAERRGQIGSGDRSERIRTYNFPQNRVTDHRIDVTLYKLDLFMQGDMDEIVQGLALRAREDAMKEEQP